MASTTGAHRAHTHDFYWPIRLPSWRQSINETTLQNQHHAKIHPYAQNKHQPNSWLWKFCMHWQVVALMGLIFGASIHWKYASELWLNDSVYFQQIFPFIRPIENFDASKCYKQITTVCLRSTHWTAVYNSSVNCNILHRYTHHFHHTHSHMQRYRAVHTMHSPNHNIT